MIQLIAAERLSYTGKVMGRKRVGGSVLNWLQLHTTEEHYGAIVGHSQNTASGKRTRVWSFTIAHVDHNNKLLWYNGGLLKNKEIDPNDFDVPTEWMIDGVWEKGATKQDMSCMRDAEVRSMQPQELDILRKTVDAAKRVDDVIRNEIPGSAPGWGSNTGRILRLKL
jgi:hypothetical protein